MRRSLKLTALTAAAAPSPSRSRPSPAADQPGRVARWSTHAADLFRRLRARPTTRPATRSSRTCPAGTVSAWWRRTDHRRSRRRHPGLGGGQARLPGRTGLRSGRGPPGRCQRRQQLDLGLPHLRSLPGCSPRGALRWVHTGERGRPRRPDLRPRCGRDGCHPGLLRRLPRPGAGQPPIARTHRRADARVPQHPGPDRVLAGRAAADRDHQGERQRHRRVQPDPVGLGRRCAGR